MWPDAPVLGEDGGDVGVVVLHRNGRNAELLGVPRRQEVRMEIVRDGDRLDLEDGPEADDGLFEEAVRLRIIHVADVLREVGAISARETDGVLQVCAGAENARNFVREVDAIGDVPTATPDQERHACDDARNGIVAARDDRAIVTDDDVANPGKTPLGLCVVDGEGLASRVGRGHHEREALRLFEPGDARWAPGALVKEKVVQGRGRQHHAEPAEVGSYVHREGLLVAEAACEHDRPAGRKEKRGLFVAQLDQRAGAR